VTHSLQIVLGSALFIGVFHTAIGLDHTLPFVALGRSRGWSLKKTLSITALCGLAHVATSVLLGLLGIAAGFAFDQMQSVQVFRGGLTAWLIVGFGAAYALYFLVREHRGRRHEHVHAHADGTVHKHEHNHHGEHLHAHAQKSGMSTWALFVIFAFGPCEALIPLLMVPAAEHNWWGILGVSGVFALATIGTMVILVGVAGAGLSKLSFPRLAPYANTITGVAICCSGLAIILLGI
jgi:nickel/cobalt exporter